MPLQDSSTFVLIIRRSKMYYTASGIITLVGGRTVHWMATLWEQQFISFRTQFSLTEVKSETRSGREGLYSRKKSGEEVQI